MIAVAPIPDTQAFIAAVDRFTATTQVRGTIAPETDRDADLAVIIDHHGHAFTDDLLLARVFRRLGWAMLTDEALAMLAREYEANRALRERMDAENRALAAGRAA